MSYVQLSASDVTSGNVLVTYIGYAPAERVGQGEVGGFQPWAQVTWLLLGLAIESPWSALGRPFLSSFARKWSFGHVEPPFLTVRLFSRSVGATIGQEV